MTPKEKAKELVQRFINKKIVVFGCYESKGKNPCIIQNNMQLESSKECALICIDEILNNVMKHWEITPDNYCIKSKMYWKEVKQEINKL